jgi:large subunit ribosomal protein L37Ae
MAKGTKKVGITGRYGPRYGVRVRKQIKDISRHRARAQRCPECQQDAVKRISSGIWFCSRCKLKFAAAAYSTRMRSFRREEATAQAEEFEREDAIAAVEEGEMPTPHPVQLRAKPGHLEESETLVKEKTAPVPEEETEVLEPEDLSEEE